MIIDALRVRPGMPPGSSTVQPRRNRHGAARGGSVGAQPAENLQRLRSGFTLVEATMALVLLGLAAAGVLLPFSSGASAQAEGLRITLAAKLANDLMERIVAAEPNEAVQTYNYAEAQGRVTDASGSVFTDPMYANFSRQVECADVRVPQESEDLPSRFIRVSVHVGYQGREIATLSRLISK